MQKNYKEIGYQYTLDVCEAISLYTSKICKFDKQAYKYRGSDLRYAVERCLYIQCINSKKLFTKYLENRKNHQSLKSIKLKSYEKDIYNLIFDESNFKIKNRFKFLIVILKKFLHIYRLIITSRKIKKTKFFPKNQVVFNLSNIKFINYIKPILKYLDENSYCFQVGSDNYLSEDIEDLGYTVLEIKNNYNYIRHFFVSKFLADFLELLKDFDNNFYSLNLNNIKSVVTFEGNAPQDIIILEVAKKLNIPCYCIQQGWSPYIHNGFRNMDYTEYFIWGKEFKKQLKRFNPNQKFTVSGSPYLKRSSSLEKIKKINTLSFFLQPVCPLMNQNAFDKFIKLIIICSNSFPDIKIIVKEHPSSNLKKEIKERFIQNKNIIFYDSNSEKLNQILESSDISLSVFSSVILESINKNKLPIICNFGSIPNYLPYIVEKNCAIEIFSINEALEIIRTLINSPEELMKYQKNIYKIKSNLFSQKNASKFISSKIK